MSIEDLLATGLPLNRKERFYTGTVFPMVVLAEGGAHFHRFMDLIGEEDTPPVDWEPDTTNIQFFTEYGLTESIHTDEQKERFPAEGQPRRDTPDIVIYIHGPEPTLIALEAKMFDAVTPRDLQHQMEVQTAVIDYLRNHLAPPPSRVHHLALVPQRVADDLGDGFPFGVVTWEQVREAFAEGRPEDHWLALLRVATEGYDTYVSTFPGFGLNADGVMSGQEILDAAAEGAATAPELMGRSGGLDGRHLAEDIETGRWRTYRYEVLSERETPNANWFPVSAFVARVEAGDAATGR